MSIFSRVLRSGEGRKLKALQALVPDINALEPEMRADGQAEHLGRQALRDGQRTLGDVEIRQYEASVQAVTTLPDRHGSSSFESLESSMWAMDRGIRSTYVDDVAISQNIFYSRLKREGHITDAECIPGVEETTEDAVRAGDVFWKINWCGVYPANRLNFTTKMETAYLKDIFSA